MLRNTAPGRTAPRAYRFLVSVIRPIIMRLTDRHWRGMENLPARGGYLVAPNHLSNLDPVTFAHALIDNDVPVKMLAKSELFAIPVFGRIIASAGMIPVHRGTSRAADSLADARAALDKGEVIGIFAEGTLSHDPDGWPMRAKTGIGRLALQSGVPVIPVAQWGAHRLMPRHSFTLVTLRRQRVDVVAGPPVDLSDLTGREVTPELARAATDRIMGEVARLLGEIRGETPPEHVWDIKVDGNTKQSFREANAALKQDRRAASLLGQVLRRLGINPRDLEGGARYDGDGTIEDAEL